MGISGYYFFIDIQNRNDYDYDTKLEVHESFRKAVVLTKQNTYTFKPITMTINRFVPKGPEDPNEKRIALILFASNLFEECPSFNKVKEEMEGIELLDLCHEDEIPKHFYDLVEESRKINVDEKIALLYGRRYRVGVDEDYVWEY